MISGAFTLATPLVLISGVFPWSRFNCWEDEIDIRSGRVRHTSYLLGVRYQDRVEETWLSRAASRPSEAPTWERVNTFSPGRGHSPHYRFHGALWTIELCEIAEKSAPFAPNAREFVANEILRRWQQDEADFEANRYAERLASAAGKLSLRGKEILSIDDLPPNSAQ
jgi:hypothetical protein